MPSEIGNRRVTRVKADEQARQEGSDAAIGLLRCTRVRHTDDPSPIVIGQPPDPMQTPPTTVPPLSPGAASGASHSHRSCGSSRHRVRAMAPTWAALTIAVGLPGWRVGQALGAGEGCTSPVRVATTAATSAELAWRRGPVTDGGLRPAKALATGYACLRGGPDQDRRTDRTCPESTFRLRSPRLAAGLGGGRGVAEAERRRRRALARAGRRDHRRR